jgi:hypothetical protein
VRHFASPRLATRQMICGAVLIAGWSIQYRNKYEGMVPQDVIIGYIGCLTHIVTPHVPALLSDPQGCDVRGDGSCFAH